MERFADSLLTVLYNPETLKNPTLCVREFGVPEIDMTTLEPIKKTNYKKVYSLVPNIYEVIKSFRGNKMLKAVMTESEFIQQIKDVIDEDKNALHTYICLSDELKSLLKIELRHINKRYTIDFPELIQFKNLDMIKKSSKHIIHERASSDFSSYYLIFDTIFHIHANLSGTYNLNPSDEHATLNVNTGLCINKDKNEITLNTDNFIDTLFCKYDKPEIIKMPMVII